MRTGGEGYNASCLRAHLHYLFSWFCLMVSCFICRNLTLPSFFSNETNFCSNEISFFYFKLLFWTKVSQNSFNFNQLKSQVYSKFQCDTLLLKNLVLRSTQIYLRGYFTSIFTDIVLHYCYCCCYTCLMLLLQHFLN